MDLYSVSIFKIQGVDQNAFLKSYDEILHGENVSIHKIINFAEYAALMNRYCNFFSIDAVNDVLILDINVGQEENYDLIDLQCLVELVMKLYKLKKYELVLLVLTADNSNYFRISQILRLWYLFHAANNSVWFRVHDTKTNKTKLQRLAVNASNQISKVLPLCQLSPQTWEILSTDCRASESEIKLINEFFNKYGELAEGSELPQKDIINKIFITQNIKVSESELYRLLISQYIITKNFEHYKYLDNCDCLSQIIFALYLNNKTNSDNIKTEELAIIKEICISFSQGILQLIENALIHPTKESNSRGFFSFRANNHAIRLEKYIQNAADIENLIEFMVSDLSLETKHAKGITASFASKHPGFEKVTLKSFFEFEYGDDENILQPYFTNPDNAVSHFGLQIFANVVVANKGCFSVTSLDSNNHLDHYFRPGTKYKYNDVRDNCFPGTTYSIILPIEKEISQFEIEKTYISNNPLHATTNAIENDWGDYPLIENPIKSLDANLTLTNRGLIIQSILDNLNWLFEWNRKPKNYCLLLNYNNQSAIVSFCKAVFIHLLKTPDLSKIVLFFENPIDYYAAVRTCCLFYDRVGCCGLMDLSKGVFLYCLTSNTQVYFSGKSLGSIISGLSNQNINGLIDNVARNQIETILKNQLININHKESFNSDICIKMNVRAPQHESTLLETELTEILNRDIHEEFVGCKISNTHFRLSKVHLDTYYEAQFLFGNSYWCMVFATYLTNEIRTKVPDKNKHIIIYGYEKYSSETLALTRSLLYALKYESVDLLFYENGDPELDADRVRFIELLEDVEYQVCYFVGISSTLSTFQKMDCALDNSIDKSNQVSLKKERMHKVLCCSAIQIVENESSDDYLPVNYIRKTSKNTVSSENLYFITDNQASFFVNVYANWYKPDQCLLCHTGYYNKGEILWNKERPLIEVDETSVIPTLLYKPKWEIKPYNSRSNFNFLNNLRNEDFLYAEHLKRKENHYQYFFRLAHIYETHKKDIKQWLLDLSKEEDFKSWLDFNASNGEISVIVSPQQNSNNGFVDDVNQYIFNGGAHTIVFDIRKEYRESFIAKYKYLTKAFLGKNIRFYYVADHIITGNTFHRTQSLITSLFDENNILFSGVFVLINRNSLRSQQALVHNYEFLPYFSFINLSIPALRSHNCPACNLVAQYNIALKGCASDFIALEFQRKIITNRVKTLKEIHELYNSENADKVSMFKYNSDRLFIENNLWNAFSMMSTNSTDELINFIKPEFDNTNQNTERIEKLCILIDVIISPMLIYQEIVKAVSISLLHSLLDEILKYYETGEILGLMQELGIELNKTDSADIQTILDKTIWGLCYMGSSRFLFPSEIKTLLDLPLFNNDEKSEAEKIQFEKRVISYIKFMLSNDKLREFSFNQEGQLVDNKTSGAKSQIIINNLENEMGEDLWENDPVFWNLLYIESVSVDWESYSSYKEEPTSPREQVNVSLRELPPKYAEFRSKKLANKKILSSNIKLLVYVDDCYCDLESFSQIDLTKSCTDSLTTIGYYKDEKNNDWYFSISNNIKLLEKDGVSNNTIRNIIGTTSVNAVMVIKPVGLTDKEQLQTIRHILIYRNELLKMLEDDYAEQFFSRSYKFARLIESTRKTVGNHGKINWNDYQFVLECLHKNLPKDIPTCDPDSDPDCDPDPSGFFSLMDIFRNAIISFANQVELLGLNSQDINFRYNPKHLDEALSIIQEVVTHFSNHNGILINYKNDFVKLDEKKYQFIMLGPSTNVGYFFLGAFAYLFLDNAYNHADIKKPINLSIEKCVDTNSYKMTLSNYIPKRVEPNSRVTVPAIKHLFEIIRDRSGPSYPEIIEDNGKTDPNIYRIELTNIIMEVPNETSRNN